MQSADSDMTDVRFLLSSYERRLSTFCNWPYKGKCSATNLAKSGFFRPANATTDVAKCFICSKELEGWEPDDDPYIEHKKHSPSCPYLKSKPYEQLTLKEGLEMDVVRYTLYLKKMETEIIDNALTQVNEKFSLLSKFLTSKVPKRVGRTVKNQSISQLSSASSITSDSVRSSRRTRAKRL